MKKYIYFVILFASILNAQNNLISLKSILLDDVNAIKAELDKGASVDSKLYLNTTPLMFSIKSNSINIAKLLLQKGADVDSKDYKGCTALSFASHYNMLELVRVLCENDAFINTINTNEETPIILAIKANSVESFKYLLDKGADIKIKHKGMDLLSIAASNPDCKEIIDILLNKGFDPHQYNDNVSIGNFNRATALFYAIESNSSYAISKFTDRKYKFSESYKNEIVNISKNVTKDVALSLKKIGINVASTLKSQSVNDNKSAYEWYSKGISLIKSGKIDEGLSVIEDNINQEISKNNPKYAVKAYLQVGRLCINQLYNYQKALYYFDKAVRLLDGIYNDEIKNYRQETIKNNEEKEKHKNSMIPYLPVYHYSPQIVLQEYFIPTLSEIAKTYKKLGNYDKSLFYNNELVKYSQIANFNYGKIWGLENIGQIFFETGDIDKSITSYMGAIALYDSVSNSIENIFGEWADVKSTLSKTYNNLGSLYLQKDDYAKAFQYFDIANFVGNNEDVFFTKLLQFFVDNNQISRAESIMKHIKNPAVKGSYYLSQNNVAKALENFNQNINEDIISRNFEMLFPKYCGLGACYLRQNKLQDAYKYFIKAIEINEEQRKELSKNDLTNFFSGEIYSFKRTYPYESIITCLIKQKRFPEAFYYSENLKGRVLAEAISKGFLYDKNIPEELADRENEYTEKLRMLTNLMDDYFKNGDKINYSQTELQYKSMKNEFDNYISSLRNTYPEYAAVKYPQPIQCSNIKLASNEVLLEFEVTKEKTYLFIQWKEKFDVKTIDISKQDLVRKITEYRNYFESVGGNIDLINFDAKLSNEIYNLLFSDLFSIIPENTKIIIIPDEILGVLPYETLAKSIPTNIKYGEGNFGPFPLGVEYLADKYQISYAQSATSLMLLRNKSYKINSSETFVLCDPIFSKNDIRSRNSTRKNYEFTSLNSWKKMGVGGITKKGSSNTNYSESELFPRLEKTSLIEDFTKSNYKGKFLKGIDAEEKLVKSTDFEPYRYVTFATHGLLENSLPNLMQPALLLNQTNIDSLNDGFLSMSEVMNLKMNAELVMLTACQTGVGKNASGEGVMGMGRAFQYAGSGNVLMSLWSVSEDASVKLTNLMYKNLKSSKDIAETYANSRNELRKLGYEHPFYWGAFILMGK